MNQNPEIGSSVIAAGIKTNFIEAGEGAPLVLIHGSGPGVTAYANWRGVIPELAKRYRVVAPDMVGFGYTDCPEDIENFDLSLWVGHIVAFLEELSIEKASFVGNSFGGALTVALAARRPDLVDRFVLMGAAGLEFEMTPGLEAVWGYQPSQENMRRLMKTFAHDTSLVTEAIVQSRHEASMRPQAQENYARLFPHPRQEKLLALATPESDVCKIEQTCMIVHGREDVIVPVEVAYRYSSLLPNSELHVFGGCGHWTQIERQSRFLELIIPFLAA